MKKLLRFIFILLISPIVLFLSLVVIAMSLNSYTSYTFTKQLFDCPLPPKTQLLDKENICGRLYGNSHGMEFTGIILIQSELPFNEISDYYYNSNFEIAKPNMDQSEKYSHGKVQVDIAIAEGRRYKPYFSERDTFYFDFPETPPDNYTLYYISIRDGGYLGLFDIRGM